jgi:hypothetical protein
LSFTRSLRQVAGNNNVRLELLGLFHQLCDEQRIRPAEV